MHEILTTPLSHSELAQRLEGCGGMPVGGLDDLLELAADGPLALETTVTHNGMTVQALVLAVPDLAMHELLALGQSMPAEYNETSADLLENTSYLAWQAAGIEVRLNAWLCRAFPGGLETQHFLVIFASRAGAAVAVHAVDDEGILALLCGMQACGIASAMNYNPWRIYSEAQLAAAAGAIDVQTPGLLTADVVHILGAD